MKLTFDITIEMERSDAPGDIVRIEMAGVGGGAKDLDTLRRENPFLDKIVRAYDLMIAETKKKGLTGTDKEEVGDGRDRSKTIN